MLQRFISHFSDPSVTIMQAGANRETFKPSAAMGGKRAPVVSSSGISGRSEFGCVVERAVAVDAERSGTERFGRGRCEGLSETSLGLPGTIL
jgi:hypothetical protein